MARLSLQCGPFGLQRLQPCRGQLANPENPLFNLGAIDLDLPQQSLINQANVASSVADGTQRFFSKKKKKLLVRMLDRATLDSRAT